MADEEHSVATDGSFYINDSNAPDIIESIFAAFEANGIDDNTEVARYINEHGLAEGNFDEIIDINDAFGISGAAPTDDLDTLDDEEVDVVAKSIEEAINDVDADTTPSQPTPPDTPTPPTTPSASTEPPEQTRKKAPKIPPKLSFPPETVEEIDDEVTSESLKSFILAEIKRKGFAGHHISSMNEFYRNGVKHIITKVFKVEGRIKNERDKTEEDLQITDISYEVEFTDVRLQPPTINKYMSGRPEALMPATAMLQGLTLSCSMSVDIVVTATARFKNGTTKTKRVEVRDQRIGNILCMEGTYMDHTCNNTREQLVRGGEDPKSVGGSFIIRGGRWAVSNMESVTINMFHVHRNMHQNEIARGMYLSRPGDSFENSYYTIIKYMTNGGITISLTTSKKDTLELPFYLLFRMVGMTRDRDIFMHICYSLDESDPVVKQMMAILETAILVSSDKFDAIKTSTDPNEIITFISRRIMESANTVAAYNDANIGKYLNSNVMSIIDKYIFPHIGTGVEHRVRKMRFLGHIIHIMLRVEMKLMESTDRDSLKNKRIVTAGHSMGKTLKPTFNSVGPKELKKQLNKDFRSYPFSEVQLADSVRQAIKSADLERTMIQTVTSGDKTIIVRRTEIQNRCATHSIQTKNDIYVSGLMGVIETPNTSSSKQNERADYMRRVHASFIGFIDPTQSADSGEKVGMVKQMGCTVSVSSTTSSTLLKLVLLSDPDIIPIDDVNPNDISVRNLTKVFVNGDWIGCCEHGFDIAWRYRQARRWKKIDPQTSIVCEPLSPELYFWTDSGRLLRPLIIVYNNIETWLNEFDSLRGKYPVNEIANHVTTKFTQWIKLRESHLVALRNNAITIGDLVDERIVEYISPDEQENAYLAPNIGTLRATQRDMRYRYTHCDIDQAILGIITLTNPLANYSSPVRTTYYTNHRKQSAGWFALNFANRIEKNTTFQWYCERPITGTIIDTLTNPNGLNTRVAYLLHTGINQEDSTIINRSSRDRGMFLQSHYNAEKTEFDKSEILGNPDYARTLDVKKGANYSYCTDGIIRTGTLASNGYVFVVKVIKLQKPIDNFIYADKSVVYRGDEDVYVDLTVYARNDEDNYVARVRYRADRPIGIGDKVSSRTGNKGIVASLLRSEDMPYDENGISPDVILNAHSLPTRMAVNQAVTGLLSLLGLTMGSFIDVTPFTEVDIDHIHVQLANYGLKYGGYHKMYNGQTGEPIDTLVFFVPDVYMQLQKFVADEHYAVRTGPTSALTKQPLAGKNANGGLKLGEMENWVLCAHGTMNMQHEKLFDDSDGTYIIFCQRCGRRAIANEQKGIYKCKWCGDLVRPVRVPMSHCASILMHEESTMGVKIQVDTEQPRLSRVLE